MRTNRISATIVLISCLGSASTLIWAGNDTDDIKSKKESGPIKINVNWSIPETIQVIVDTINLYVYKKADDAEEKRRIEKLQNIRYLLSQLAGEEAQLAGQLKLGVQQAIDSQADQLTGVVLNRRLSQTRATFVKLSDEITPLKNMPGVDSKSIGGLHCFIADSALFGYGVGGCRLGKPALFAARGKGQESSNALLLADQLQTESGYLYDLAEQLDKLLKAK